MVADRVRDFPVLRPHQRHPWHAFLAQLAAIALHRSAQTEPWADAADWRAALLALTPDDADGAAWCLVAPPERPALLQPRVPGERERHPESNLVWTLALLLQTSATGHEASKLQAQWSADASDRSWEGGAISSPRGKVPAR